MSDLDVRETLLTEMRHEECNQQADCLPVVLFSDDDLIGETEHNRPLMIEGYICGKKIKRVMIDNGSAVNLLPLSMINKLGYRRSDLRPSGMMIQGFNQDGQRALGKITVTMEVGELVTNVVCHVINAVTTYNLLLGRLWIHQYG
ncbi:retropepsin-like aspartic protease, partial [Mycobacterium kansasii]